MVLISTSATIAYNIIWFSQSFQAVDANVYRAGGSTVWNSNPLYREALWGGLKYTYPPFSAILFAPLSLISVTTMQTLSQIVNLILLSCCVYISFRAVDSTLIGRQLYMRVAFVTSISLFFEPVRTTMMLGQVNLLLMLFVLLGTVGLGGRVLASLVGISAAIKITPSLFIIRFALQRDWRKFLSSIIGLTAATLTGLIILTSDSLDYFGEYSKDFSRVSLADTIGNQSMKGLVARLLETSEPPLLSWLLPATGVLILGIAAAYISRCVFKNTLLDVTIYGMLATVVSPFSWEHHWVWFVPLLVCAINIFEHSRLWLTALLPMGIILLVSAWFIHENGGGMPSIGLISLTLNNTLLQFMASNAYVLITLSVIFAVLAKGISDMKRTPNYRGPSSASQAEENPSPLIQA